MYRLWERKEVFMEKLIRSLIIVFSLLFVIGFGGVNFFEYFSSGQLVVAYQFESLGIISIFFYYWFLIGLVVLFFKLSNIQDDINYKTYIINLVFMIYGFSTVMNSNIGYGSVVKIILSMLIGFKDFNSVNFEFLVLSLVYHAIIILAIALIIDKFKIKTFAKIILIVLVDINIGFLLNYKYKLAYLYMKGQLFFETLIDPLKNDLINLAVFTVSGIIVLAITRFNYFKAN
jgi:hypothetical protein